MKSKAQAWGRTGAPQVYRVKRSGMRTWVGQGDSHRQNWSWSVCVCGGEGSLHLWAVGISVVLAGEGWVWGTVWKGEGCE